MNCHAILVTCLASGIGLATAADHPWTSDSYADDPSQAAARILSKQPSPLQRVMQVGAMGVVVHEGPGVDTPAICALGMGDAVEVVEGWNWYRVPTSSLMNEFGDEEIVASWVRIKGPNLAGFVPARSLVAPEVLAAANAAAARKYAAEHGDDAAGGFTQSVRRKRGKVAMRGAGRPSKAGAASGAASGGGFSQNVKHKKGRVAKGVAGTPKMDGADYALIDAIIAESNSPLGGYRAAAAFRGAEVGEVESIDDREITLDAIAPELAAKLRKEAALADSGSGEASREADNGGGLFGGSGLGGAGGLLGGGDVGGGLFGGSGGGLGSEAKQIAEVASIVADLVDEFTAERTATPLEEYYLGRECAALSTGGKPRLPADHPVSKYISDIGHSLARHSTMPYPTAGYQFIVLDDPEVPNAIAAPGGFIFITTKMLQTVQDEDQLAVILGHEIAHCEERHGIIAANEASFGRFPAFIAIFEMVEQKVLDAVIKEALADVQVPSGVDVVGQIRSELIAMATEGFREIIARAVTSIQKPTTEAEQAADMRGISLACAAGYDPAAMFGLLETIKETHGHYGGAGYSDTRSEDIAVLIPHLPRGIHRCERFDVMMATLNSSGEF